MSDNLLTTLLVIILCIGWCYSIFLLTQHAIKAFNATPHDFWKTTGIVKNYALREETQQCDMPVITYTINRRELTFTETNYTFSSFRPLNKKVCVYYNPSNPSEARMKMPFFSSAFFRACLIFIYSSNLLVTINPNHILPNLLTQSSTELDVHIGLMGCMFFAYGLYAWSKIDKIRRYYVKTLGIVHKFRNTRQGFEFVVKFFVDDKEIEFTEYRIVYVFFNCPKKGDQLTVFYNPLDPEKAFIYPQAPYIIPLIFSGFCTITFTLTAYIFIAALCCMFLYSAYQLCKHLKKVITFLPDTYIKTTGVIKEYVSQKNSATHHIDQINSTAQINQNTHVENDETTPLTYPVIGFNIDGLEYTFTETTHTLPYLPFTCLPSLGQSVPVIYNTMNPQEAQLKVPFYSYTFVRNITLFIYSLCTLLILIRNLWIGLPQYVIPYSEIAGFIFVFFFFCIGIYLWYFADKIYQKTTQTTGTIIATTHDIKNMDKFGIGGMEIEFVAEGQKIIFIDKNMPFSTRKKGAKPSPFSTTHITHKMPLLVHGYNMPYH